MMSISKIEGLLKMLYVSVFPAVPGTAVTLMSIVPTGVNSDTVVAYEEDKKDGNALVHVSSTV